MITVIVISLTQFKICAKLVNIRNKKNNDLNFKNNKT